MHVQTAYINIYYMFRHPALPTDLDDSCERHWRLLQAVCKVQVEEARPRDRDCDGEVGVVLDDSLDG